MSEIVLERPAAAEATALTKATVRAAQRLGLTNRTLAAVIGLSEATISRMGKGEYLLARGDKAFELSVLFVRLFRSLDMIVGGDEKSARAWISNENLALHGVPTILIQNVGGLIDVVRYLESRRDRV